MGAEGDTIKEVQHRSLNFSRQPLFSDTSEARKNSPFSWRAAQALKRKTHKNPLALRKTCGRLAPFSGFAIQIPKVVGRIVRNGESFNREVRVDGPCFSR